MASVDNIKFYDDLDESSLFTHLVEHNPRTTQVLFDQSLTTNGHNLNSSELVVIWNLAMFKRESEREESKGNDIAVLSKLEDLEGADSIDELILHPTCENLSKQKGGNPGRAEFTQKPKVNLCLFQPN